MHADQLFGSIAIGLSILAFAPYFVSILKGKTQPHLYSWIIWSLIQTTAVWIMFSEGAEWGAAASTVGTVLCVGVSILSLRYGTKNITRFDTLCLIGAFIAFAIYAFVKEPYISLSLVLVIEICGFIPTFRKAIRDPASEKTITWALFGISNVFALLALPAVSFLTAGYPVSLLFFESSLALTLVVRRMRTRL